MISNSTDNLESHLLVHQQIIRIKRNYVKGDMILLISSNLDHFPWL